MSIDDLSILGKPVRESKQLEGFTTPEGLSSVTLRSDEVTACCPVTGQRDFYTVTIAYVPGSLCLESKSLKLYLNSFANEGVFVEALATQIRQDVMAAIQPRTCRVEVFQKARGGITITAVADETGSEGTL
jgi:7-cyano-7-deazaguanine reductase